MDYCHSVGIYIKTFQKGNETMKQITETKLVEQTTTRFFADDGKEFKTEDDCKRYEKTLYEERYKKLFDSVNHKEIDLPLLDWACEANAYIIRMNNASEYRITVDYFESVMSPYCDVDISEPVNYHCIKIIIAEWGCGAYEFCNTLDSLIDRYYKMIEEITIF